MMTPDNARMALRTATHAFHDRVDAAFSRARLDDRASYGQFLTAQAAAYLPTEEALEQAGIGAVVADWSARRRSAALRADLADLDKDVPAPAGVIALNDEAALLGALYVLEGSRLGGALLSRSVAPGLPMRFLTGGDSAAWRRLLALLDERLDTEAKRITSIKAAGDVFMLFEASARTHLEAI